MEEEEAIEMESNWADLPPGLFPLVLEKLPEIYDFVRSRAVCKPWRFSSSVSDLPPQFPWIIRLSEGPDLELYSIAFNKVYTICVRCSSGKRLFGPGQVGNANSFSLLNPLNNSEIPLPVLHDCNPYLSPRNFSWFSPMIFPSDNYVFATDYGLSLGCKPSDDRWDIIGPGHEFLYRCYYLKGLLFRVMGHTGVTKIMDINSRKELYVIQPPKHENMSKMFFEGPYLVKSGGEILAVCYNKSDKRMNFKFYIHRLELGNGRGNPCWVKISTIGDRILFFDFFVGTGRGFCFRASDFVGFKENCIYFLDKVPAFCLGEVHVINVYDIENGETVFIDTPFDRKSHITWFMPTLNHI